MLQQHPIIRAIGTTIEHTNTTAATAGPRFARAMPPPRSRLGRSLNPAVSTRSRTPSSLPLVKRSRVVQDSVTMADRAGPEPSEQVDFRRRRRRTPSAHLRMGSAPGPRAERRVSSDRLDLPGGRHTSTHWYPHPENRIEASSRQPIEQRTIGVALRTVASRVVGRRPRLQRVTASTDRGHRGWIRSISLSRTPGA